MKFYYDANSQKSRMYQRWNKTTAMCYFRNMKCEGCFNNDACSLNQDNFNLYHIRQVKYSTLMTYANIGKPRKDFLEDED